MKSLTLVFTLAAVALSASASLSDLSTSNTHRALHNRLSNIKPASSLEANASVAKPRRRKRSLCAAMSSSSAAAAASTSASSSSAWTSSSTSVWVAPTTTSSSDTWTSTSSSVAAASSSASTSTDAGGNTYTGDGHTFSFSNQCSYSVVPVLVDVSGTYDSASGTTQWSSTLNSLAAGGSYSATVPSTWNGRLFAQDSACGSLGEDCTMGEFNLGADSIYTPNSWDVSIIQGFTQSMSIASGGNTAICTSASCTCPDAYPVGDMTGCGDDAPVKATSSGDKTFDIVFCP